MRGRFLRLITLKWVLGRVKQELVFVESVLSKRGGGLSFEKDGYGRDGK
jgi:hypothetical protein